MSQQGQMRTISCEITEIARQIAHLALHSRTSLGTYVADERDSQLII